MSLRKSALTNHRLSELVREYESEFYEEYGKKYPYDRGKYGGGVCDNHGKKVGDTRAGGEYEDSCERGYGICRG